MTSKTLDKSRAYGVVVGSSDGSAFHQDGVCFRGDGTEVGSPQVIPGAGQEVVNVAPPTPADTGGVTREDLQALHPSAIKKLVEAEGLTVITGAGSKAKNIEQLLAG